MEFIDTYTVAIHDNEDLTAVEKFSYLKSCVGGEAEKCLEGLTLTAPNYKHGMEILKERFGNKQIIISKHMSILLGLEKVKSSSFIKKLRALYDMITVNLRALLSYEIESTQFGPMLVPVILGKLPDDIRFEVSRKMNGEDWDLDNLRSKGSLQYKSSR